MTIRDIRKRYDLRKITYHQQKTNIWTYGLIVVVAAILVLAVACQLKKRLSGRSHVQERRAVNTYISMSTIGTDAGTDASNLEEQAAPIKKSETAKITTNS